MLTTTEFIVVITLKNTIINNMIFVIDCKSVN
jgi:hypothetical protein